MFFVLVSLLLSPRIGNVVIFPSLNLFVIRNYNLQLTAEIEIEKENPIRLRNVSWDKIF